MKKNILEISYIFAENSGTNQNCIEHVQCACNILFLHLYYIILYKKCLNIYICILTHFIIQTAGKANFHKKKFCFLNFAL